MECYFTLLMCGIWIILFLNVFMIGECVYRLRCKYNSEVFTVARGVLFKCVPLHVSCEVFLYVSVQLQWNLLICAKHAFILHVKVVVRC